MILKETILQKDELSMLHIELAMALTSFVS